MYEKDYLMRLFTDFMKAINRILNCIDQNDTEGAKKQINYSYQLLGNDSNYFLKTSLEDIVVYFKEKEGDYLKRVKMLAELIYCDSLVQDNNIIKKTKLEKSLNLLEFYSKNTKEYSINLINRLNCIKTELQTL